MSVTRVGKILQEIVERIGERKDVYTKARFSESYLGKQINNPLPLGPTVLTKICRAFKEDAEGILFAWLGDRGDQYRKKAEEIRDEVGLSFSLEGPAADTALRRAAAKLEERLGPEDRELVAGLFLRLSRVHDWPMASAALARSVDKVVALDEELKPPQSGGNAVSQ